MTRRSLCAMCLASPLAAQATQLSAQDLPSELSKPLNIDSSWFRRQTSRQLARIVHGSAEHIAYFLLQSKSFTDEPVIAPLEAARRKLPFPKMRAAHFLKVSPTTARHRLIHQLYAESNWTLERCYEHTLQFLTSKEIDHAPLEPLYQARGLSSDTSPESLTGIATLSLNANRVLLVGPGLDLTRREDYSDSLPLVSHQFNYLKARFQRVDMIDIRPEVIAHLGARRHDVTTHVLDEQYDLIVATNLFVYLNDAELLCAIAGLSRSLSPQGRLVHNDTRFAAKVFGEAVQLPVEKFQPVHLGGRKWDRLVIHQKVKT